MRVIPVIDLLGGQVVRGVAGRRDEYRPIVSQIAADARPATVARALVERFGFDTVYVADLDAIMRGQPDVRAWSEIADAGLKLWLDAGVGDARLERRIVELMKQARVDFRLIVGLESLESLEALMAITKAGHFPIVSLDLKAGSPLTRIDHFRNAQPLEIARTLDGCGIRDLIVLDLADVGMNAGASTIGFCREISAEYPGKLISGGGVRGFEDLQALSDAGCSGALVASALHDRRLTRADVERAKRLLTPDP
jgi:phosphoribosylformimino-5-aminoimidazole carboxamide ribotide isomerase